MIDIEIPTTVLTAAVKASIPHLTTETHLPALSRLLLTVKDGSLSIMASRGTSARLERLKCDVHSEGAIAISGKGLLSILNVARGKSVRLTVDETSFWATIKTGRSKVQLAASPATDYPDVVEFPADAEAHEADAEALVTALGRVLYAASTKENQTNLHGVFFEVRGEDVHVVTTDGHRLATYQTTTKAWPLDTTLLTLSSAQRLHREVEDSVSLRTTPDDRYIVATLSDSTWIALRTSPAKFPPWSQLVPKTKKGALRFKRADALAAIREVLPSAPETNYGELHLDDSLTIQARNENGQAITEADVSVEGKPPSLIATSLRYLSEALEAAEDEDAEVWFQDALDPMVVHEGPYRGLVMPMRLSGAASA